MKTRILFLLSLLGVHPVTAQDAQNSKMLRTEFSRPTIQKNHLVVPVKILNMHTHAIFGEYGACEFTFRVLNSKQHMVYQDPHVGLPCPTILYSQKVQPREAFRNLPEGVGIPLKVLKKGTYTVLTRWQVKIWTGNKVQRVTVKGKTTFTR